MVNLKFRQKGVMMRKQNQSQELQSLKISLIQTNLKDMFYLIIKITRR